MKLKDYLLVSVLTAISPLIYGYYFNVLDHHHYLPYINKLLNPALYLNDYYFSQPHNLYSPFNYFIVFIKKLFNLNLPWTYFIIYFVSLWLLYFAIYYLTQTIYKKSAISALAVFLFLLPKWAAQIGYLTHHFYFVSRDLSLGLSLIALSLILKKKSLPSAILIALAALVNPSIPIPVAILWILFWLKNLTNKLPAFLPINQPWLNTLKQRGTYSFPHLWKWTGWGNLALFLSLLASGYLALRQNIFGKYLRLINKFIFICFSLFIFHFIISVLIPIPQLIQLQLLRSLNYIFIISLIVFAATIFQLFASHNRIYKLTASIALLGVYFWADHLTIWHFLAIWTLPLVLLIKPLKHKLKPQLASQTVFKLIFLISLFHLLFQLVMVKPSINLPFYFHYPSPLVNLDHFSSWLDIQIWAKNNTTEDKIFLTHPQQSGFRNFSQRSIVGDLKDGGLIFYSSDYARNWQGKMNDLQNFSQFNTNDFNNLKQKHSFDYIVVAKNHQLVNIQLIYQNNNFSVYKI